MFNGKEIADLNGVLTGFQAMMNFVDSVITAGSDVLKLEYTVFKIRYLALYTVLASLRVGLAAARRAGGDAGAQSRHSR
ncbi:MULTISPECIES: hypothetical protein [unclassified Streptomyces]|uniref:hypothetical protein n=1 Tax=unclassified Streptomyces TaxID=2593676 RepID=UPI00136CEA2B|nr:MULTISPECIES: hypothetical protein [unclassified Streptomyces]MYS21217.1 hypothetical protein [Streptomyces sp. SID4948]